MTVPALESLYRVVYEDSGQINPKLHEYFRVQGYKCPTEYSSGAFQWVHNTKLGYFEWLKERPSLLQDLGVCMSGVRSAHKFWADWYPVHSALLDGLETEDGVLLVDVGGSKGHDLQAFMDRFPEATNKLVLQDLPQVIESVQQSLSPGIRAEPYDFFQPQKLKGMHVDCIRYLTGGAKLRNSIGARAYFTHFVFHDWPDDKARDILLNLKGAMKPGYSKLLLNESILPNRDCDPWYAATDLNMLCILAGIKRSRKQWADLIDSVGLQLEQIFESPDSGSHEGIIQIGLKL